MKKILIIISVLFNLVIISAFIYLSSNLSLSASNEDEIEKPIENKTNFDSINKQNKNKITEISPSFLEKKIVDLSQSKKCVVVYWASWCQYCPSLIDVLTEIKADTKFDFNYVLVSIDKPNTKGKESLLKKAAKLNLKGEVYIVDENRKLDISNAKVIYQYLPKASKFDENPGFPHIIIFDKNKIVFEDTGFDKVYGISKFIDLLKK